MNNNSDQPLSKQQPAALFLPKRKQILKECEEQEEAEEAEEQRCGVGLTSLG